MILNIYLDFLLGGISEDASGVTDLFQTNIKPFRIAWVNNANVQNCPSQFGYCIMIGGIRVFLGYPNGKMYWAIYVNSTWSGWNET